MDRCDRTAEDGIISPAEIKQNFILFDHDRSGEIDLDEFVNELGYVRTTMTMIMMMTMMMIMMMMTMMMIMMM